MQPLGLPEKYKGKLSYINLSIGVNERGRERESLLPPPITFAFIRILFQMTFLAAQAIEYHAEFLMINSACILAKILVKGAI